VREERKIKQEEAMSVKAKQVWLLAFSIVIIHAVS
jgi:hypothetical protein